jgi:hypothetical protein
MPSQAEQDRKSSVKIETVKVRPEDKRWAADNGLHGELGAFQGMIARYRSGAAAAPPLDATQQLQLQPSEMRIAVYVRKRPLLPDEKKANDFDVVTCAPVRRYHRAMPCYAIVVTGRARAQRVAGGA